MRGILAEISRGRVAWVFWGAIFGFFYLIALDGPLFCLVKAVTGFPCSGCGLTRACLLIAHFRFADAARQNILVAPLALSAFTGGVCFFADTCFGKNWLRRYKSALTSAPAVALSVFLAAASWIYNIAAGN